MVKNDIEELHTYLSFDQFSYKLNNVHLKWSTYPSLNKFRDYFFKEWCYHNNEWSRFSCWQLFQQLIILLNHSIKQSKACILCMR